MSIRALVARLSALGRRDAIDAELAEEIAEHIRLAAEEKQARGLSPRDALDAARREFGNPTLARESSREAWRWPAIDAFAADLRFGVRMLRKRWVTTAVAIGALGLAIGVPSAWRCSGQSDPHRRATINCRSRCPSSASGSAPRIKRASPVSPGRRASTCRRGTHRRECPRRS
jgi:hypothetical protein